MSQSQRACVHCFSEPTEICFRVKLNYKFKTLLDPVDLPLAKMVMRLATKASLFINERVMSGSLLTLVFGGG